MDKEKVQEELDELRLEKYIKELNSKKKLSRIDYLERTVLTSLLLIKKMIRVQEKSYQSVYKIIRLIVLAVVFLLNKDLLTSYIYNGVTLFKQTTPDQKFNLFYIIPLTALISYFIARHINKKDK